MSQLTFHCLMVLYLQVFTTSPTLRSMRIKRLLAMPNTSSLRQPLNLMWTKIMCFFYDVTYNVILFWLNYVTQKIPK